jgi:hypothetical protein
MNNLDRIDYAKKRIQELELLISYWEEKNSLCSMRDLPRSLKEPMSQTKLS